MSENFTLGLGMFLLRAGLLLTLFWAAYASLRVNPRARVMLCRIVAVGVVLLPLLNFLPLPAMLNLPAFHHASAQQTPLPPEPVRQPEAPAVKVANDHDPAPIPGPRAVPVASRTIARPWKLPPWPVGPALAMAWLVMTSLLLARWSIALFLTRRLTAAAQSAPDWVHEVAGELRAQLGIRGKVGLRITEKSCSPLLLGPGAMILLPRHLVAKDSTGDLRAALAHELGHVQQRDWPWSQGMHLVTILAWPLPWGWFLRRAHDAASELVCDHVAAAMAGGAVPYAGSLARQALLAVGHPYPVTVPMLRKSGIRQRIDLLLSGGTLPILQGRTIMAVALLTLFATGLLASLRPARAADEPPKSAPPTAKNAEVQKEFEAVAGEFSYFELEDAFHRRTGYSSNLADDFPKYEAFMAHFFSIRAGKDELIPLLKHQDPKVRTLAIGDLLALDDPSVLPFIADLLADKAITFSTSVYALRHDVAVGEVAQNALAYYLRPAGYGAGRKEFDEYWSAHQGRPYCASWFSVRLDKTNYLGPERYYEVLRPIRADVDKVPLPERFWIALWLIDNRPLYKLLPSWWHREPPRPLYSQEELLEMGQKIGPQALMKVLTEKRFPGADPDLRHGNDYNGASGDTKGFRFILKNAGTLLRPEDGEALLSLNSGKNISPLWFIAASQVQPAKAAEILRPAFAQFTHVSYQLDLCAALWQAGGESQAPFIVDKFYEFTSLQKNESGGSVGPEYGFISQISWIEKPPGRKLIADILQDKRLDTFEANTRNMWTFVNIARSVNGWAGQVIVSDAEIGEILNSQQDAPGNTELRKQWLHRLRDTAPQWSN